MAEWGWGGGGVVERGSRPCLPQSGCMYARPWAFSGAARCQFPPERFMNVQKRTLRKCVDEKVLKSKGGSERRLVEEILSGKKRFLLSKQPPGQSFNYTRAGDGTCCAIR